MSNCSTCKFRHSNAMAKTLECRKHPPQIAIHSGTGAIHSAFPGITDESWCGEWVACEAVQAEPPEPPKPVDPPQVLAIAHRLRQAGRYEYEVEDYLPEARHLWADLQPVDKPDAA